ncbi:MAG: DNA (cytosine-5-)-methyltransferase [Candidatus Pacebacteria bacterium]|jgi:DNA (cytosine-5)-methyltransferase 1|nr:DNA (cytosine-5-)-methyltransferase [Candidatus Paceibacterota bacterium]
MATNNDKIRVVELFAGVGGFRVGFEKAAKNRFETVWFNQWEPGKKQQHAHDVYAKRWNTDGLSHTNTDLEEVVKNYIDSVPDHDLLVGGFPCQDYSVAKPLRQSAGIIGKKGVLWWSIVSLVQQLQERPDRKAPEILLLENVDRLLKSPGTQRGRDFAIMLRSLETLGYDVEWRVINAADYGFPQRRRRIFILAYKNDSGIAKQMQSNGHIDWLHTGTLGKAFPIEKAHANSLQEIVLHDDEKQISDNFGRGLKVSPFHNAGVMINGQVYTTKVTSKTPKSVSTLGDFILSDDEVTAMFGDKYFIDDKDVLEKWKIQKGPKKIERINKKTGEPYFFTEGGMAFPDHLDKPSRTIVTGEGGSGPSRFKHVIQAPQSGRYRRLTPIELEQLSMFPKNHTAEGINGRVSDNVRAFFIGNALVTGVITEIGKKLVKHVDEYGI